jgi:predicted nucleotide-binding protein
VDLERKLALIDKQIEEAREGNPENFDDWRGKTEVVLRTIFGQKAPLYKRFENVRYSPSLYYSGMDTTGYRPAGVREVISILNSAKVELELAAEVEEVVADTGDSGEVAPGGRVFIVHGHDNERKLDLARFLKNLTAHEPTILHEQPNKGRTLIEKFEQSAGATGYAVILMTADDLGRAKDDSQEKPRGRQNVVFEMGFFFGSFGRERTAVLYDDDIESVGDISGLVYISLDDAGGWKAKLATEIEAAGITVYWSALGKG